MIVVVVVALLGAVLRWWSIRRAVAKAPRSSEVRPGFEPGRFPRYPR